jgi:hypothetical protein
MAPLLIPPPSLYLTDRPAIATHYAHSDITSAAQHTLPPDNHTRGLVLDPGALRPRVLPLSTRSRLRGDD